MIFLATAWAWLQKNWKWVVFPVGVVLLVLGWTRKTNISVVSPTLDEAELTAKRLNEQAAKQLAEAEAKKAKELAAVDAAEQAEIKAIIDAQKAEKTGLAQDPDLLNKKLLDAGKQQRGPS